MIANRLTATVTVALFLSVGCGDRKQGGPATSQPGQVAGEPEPAVATAPPPLTALEAIPADAQLVVGVDVDAVKGSPLIGRGVELMLARNPALAQRVDRLLELCGFDPAVDLQQLALAFGDSSERVILIASGKLEEKQLTQCLSRGMAELGGGLSSLTPSADSAGSPRTIYHARSTDRSVWYGFANPTTVVVSASQRWLETALGEGGKLAEGELGELVAKRQRQGLWFTGLIPEKIATSLLAAVDTEVEKPPRAIVGEIAIGSGLVADIGLVMTSEEDANHAASKAVPELSLSALVAQRLSLGPLVSKIQVSVASQIVHLRISLTDAEVIELLARLSLVNGEVDTGGADEEYSGPQ